MNRRAFLLMATALPVAAALAPPARASTRLLVHTDPSCGCCGSWVDHIRKAGFTAEVRKTPDIAVEKARLGVPVDLFSCHTAEIDGYVIEGHVPAGAIRRLLAERPEAIGLSVPGMPVGSPGMDVAVIEPEVYEVILFGPTGSRTYATYRGGLRLSS